MKSKVFLNGKNGDILYSIVFERWECLDGVWQWVPGGIDNVMARNAVIARNAFWEALEYRDKVRYQDPNSRITYGRTRIVSIAPAVGFHVADNHGDRLIA